MKRSLHHFYDEKYEAALFSFDQSLSLKTVEGKWSSYIKGNLIDIEGLDIHELFPYLSGVDFNSEQELLYIQTNEHDSVDITIKPEQGQTNVFFVNSGINKTTLQTVQQTANDSSLREEVLISEKQALEIEAKAKQEIIASFSHEISTPLNSIIGYTEVLLQNETCAENQAMHAHLKSIDRNTHYLANLINNILDQKRLENNQLTVNEQPVILEDIIKAVSKIIGFRKNKDRVSFHEIWHCHKTDVVTIDKQRTIQILVNILGNAFKYTKTGKVTIDINYAQNQLTFTVIDTGIGIPGDEIEAINDDYFRASNVRLIPGTGIGLSLSKRIATTIGGDLTITSKEGSGTTVTIQLPANHISDYDFPVVNDQRQTLLVIDDDSDIHNLIQCQLDDDNIEILVAEDSKTAFDQIALHSIDLILIDKYLNGENGLDVSQNIRTNGYIGRMVMVTAYSDNTLIEQAYHSGCNSLIYKPIGREKVLEQLNHVE